MSKSTSRPDPAPAPERNSTHWFDIHGFSTYQGELSEVFNINSHTLCQRLKQGWPIESACLAPINSGWTHRTVDHLQTSDWLIPAFVDRLTVYFKQKNAAIAAELKAKAESQRPAKAVVAVAKTPKPTLTDAITDLIAHPDYIKNTRAGRILRERAERLIGQETSGKKMTPLQRAESTKKRLKTRANNAK